MALPAECENDKINCKLAQTSDLHKEKCDIDDGMYYALVIDSGPIIRLQTGNSNMLWNRAERFYTVPAVISEIRDARAREQLQLLPFQLNIREPSAENVQIVKEFARKTGDYQSLSSVDLQVLGLVYELEKEGCGDVLHLRSTPKRMIGLGKVQTLGSVGTEQRTRELQPFEATEVQQIEECSDENEDSSACSSDSCSDEVSEDEEAAQQVDTKPKITCWAKIVSADAADSPPVTINPQQNSSAMDAIVTDSLATMNLQEVTHVQSETSMGNGIHSNDEDVPAATKNHLNDLNQDDNCFTMHSDPTIELDSLLDFPCLSAAVPTPYGNDDNDDVDPFESGGENVAKSENRNKLFRQRQEQEVARKKAALLPLSKSGKLYNSFRKYGDLMKPKKEAKKETPVTDQISVSMKDTPEQKNEEKRPMEGQSRIIGYSGGADQDDEVEDDGEGWIMNITDAPPSPNHLDADFCLPNHRVLDPTRTPSQAANLAAKQISAGPSVVHRTACATTDFAMQNVILQMNLVLLSLDGVKIRKLKSWVTRCGACYKVYTDSTGSTGSLPTRTLGRRLFCEHCGSDLIQRIAASVDGKTGRIRLHLSKRYKHNLRGTKYSLPKPGTGNRFQGDLLLREDQLLMGAWNQKLKMRCGGRAKSAAESIFGRDIASNVGCQVKSITDDDIRVGFGRRNPNAAKGRERRGKKKKSVDKACGLRRY